MTRLEQFYEWRSICVQSDTVLRNYAESMRAVTATISCQVSRILIYYSLPGTNNQLCVYTRANIQCSMFISIYCVFSKDGAFTLDKMTAEQKSAYLEAHMEVQQHMQQVSMQLNKQMTSQLNSNHLNHHLNPALNTTNLHVPNQYSNANSIKVSRYRLWQEMHI